MQLSYTPPAVKELFRQNIRVPPDFYTPGFIGAFASGAILMYRDGPDFSYSAPDKNVD